MPPTPARPVFEPLYLRDNLTVLNPSGLVGIVTLWSKTDAVLNAMRSAGVDVSPESSPIAVVANLYGDGLAKMLSNLLYNPQIRRLVIWGRDLSDSKSALQRFFAEGVVDGKPGSSSVCIAGTNRRLPSILHPSLFGAAPEIVDVGEEVNATRAAAIAAVLRLEPPADWPERVRIEIPEPVVDYKPSAPYNHSVVADTPCETWRELLFRLREFGKSVPHETSGGDRLELLNVRATIRNPRPEDEAILRLHHLEPAALQRYQQELSKPDCPADLSYTYGSRLRTYFGVDSLEECARILRAERGSRHAYISLWDTAADFRRDTVPCMVSLFFRVYDEALSLTACFRAHNAGTAWIQNVYGLIPIIQWMAAQIDVEPGPLIVVSESISLRKSEMAKVEDLIQLYERRFVQYRPDPHGHFEIAIEDGTIVATQRSEGAVINRFEGPSAQVLEHHIARAAAVSEVTHALYLGRELTRAEECLKSGQRYVQK